MAAAGFFARPLHLLLIDADRTHGNGEHTKRRIANYHQIYLATQPKSAYHAKKGWMSTKQGEAAPPPEIFQQPINQNPYNPAQQQPCAWQDASAAGRSFRTLIDYGGQADEVQRFLDLFYEPADLALVLDQGYRARPNIGAVALKQDLERSAGIAGQGLQELLVNLNQDLQNGDARVFVIGSVFGGTGAAGLPTFPALVKNLASSVIAEAHREKIRYGCAMLTPYFTFPQGTPPAGQIGPDSTQQAVATQAALLHYAGVPPEYEHIYLIGAPNRVATSNAYQMGGSDQANQAHYVELVAALAAWQFFGLNDTKAKDGNGNLIRQVHYADTLQQATNGSAQEHDIVTWQTLPTNDTWQQSEIRQRLANFTTLAAYYCNVLHQQFDSQRTYEKANWYKDNFKGNVKLSHDAEILRQVHTFLSDYLTWLRHIAATGGNRLALFQAGNLSSSRDDQLNNLLTDGGQIAAAHDAIYKNIPHLMTLSADTQPAGLLLYLLHHGVTKFCESNYLWQQGRSRAG